jgi:hypothetical protein
LESTEEATYIGKEPHYHDKAYKKHTYIKKTRDKEKKKWKVQKVLEQEVKILTLLIESTEQITLRIEIT